MTFYATPASVERMARNVANNSRAPMADMWEDAEIDFSEPASPILPRLAQELIFGLIKLGFGLIVVLVVAAVFSGAVFS